MEERCRSLRPLGEEDDILVHLRCLELLHMYAARVFSESTSDADLAALQRQTVPDTELLGILNALVALQRPPRFSARGPQPVAAGGRPGDVGAGRRLGARGEAQRLQVRPAVLNQHGARRPERPQKGQRRQPFGPGSPHSTGPGAHLYDFYQHLLGREVILSLLASSISLCFLIEVDQSEGRFLAEKPEDSLRRPADRASGHENH